METGDLIKGRYELVRFLGSGSFGEVWRAEDRMIGKDVALKIYLTLDPAGVEEFKREYANTLDLSSPHLLTPHYFDVWERRPFLVMKYCERGSAAKLAGHITENELWKFVHDVAAGLDVLHSQQEPMVHQDIKPDNILVDGDGRFLITDFGISKRLRATMRKQSSRDVTSGAIPYMAPERFESTAMLSTASDVWSLGASIYELATGELPFSGLGGRMQLTKAEMPSLDGNWSADLNRLMQSCLASNASERPTARQVADLSDGILNGKPVLHVGEATGEGWTYQGELLDGKPHGRGTKRFDNGNTYEGDFVNGKFDGYGKYVWANGGYYEGNWKDGKRDGQGKRVFVNGGYYEGEWKDDKANGFGKRKYQGGYYYEGNWKDDKRDGYGKLTNPDGKCCFEGNWKDDEQDGQGKHTTADGNFNFKAAIYCIIVLAITVGCLWWGNAEQNGHITSDEWRTRSSWRRPPLGIRSKKDWTYQGGLRYWWPHGKGILRTTDGSYYYEGNFKDGYFNGQGKEVQADGSYREGNWKKINGFYSFDGQGKQVFADGGYYEGNFIDSKFYGQGKRVWANGDYYVGNWINDKRNGQGKLVFGKENTNNCDYYEGNWKDDNWDGQGKLVWTDGSYYEGNWKDGHRDGQGKEVWADGGYHEGNWKDGKPNGYGKRQYWDGSYYEGNWKDGKRNGQGKLVWTGGYYEGNWKDDKKDGHGKEVYADGEYYEGNWKDGSWTGQGIHVPANSGYYGGNG